MYGMNEDDNNQFWNPDFKMPGMPEPYPPTTPMPQDGQGGGLENDVLTPQQLPKLGYSGPLPQGYSQGEVDDWLSRNPGDEHRIMSALSPKAQPQFEVPNATALATGNTGQAGFFDKINGYLDNVLKNQGNFDMGLINKRKESVKDVVDTARMKQTSNLKANLASRGLLSLPGAPSGVEAGGLTALEGDLGTAYSGALRDIFSNEQENASQRFMDALGLTSQNANNAAINDLGTKAFNLSALNADRGYGLDTARLGLDRTRTQGDLALRQADQELASRLGLGRLDLDTSIAETAAKNSQGKTLEDLINQLLNAANTSSGGYF